MKKEEIKQELTTNSGTAFKTGLFATLGIASAGIIVPIIIIILTLMLCCGCSVIGSLTPSSSSSYQVSN